MFSDFFESQNTYNILSVVGFFMSVLNFVMFGSLACIILPRLIDGNAFLFLKKKYRHIQQKDSEPELHLIDDNNTCAQIPTNTVDLQRVVLSSTDEL